MIDLAVEFIEMASRAVDLPRLWNRRGEETGLNHGIAWDMMLANGHVSIEDGEQYVSGQGCIRGSGPRKYWKCEEYDAVNAPTTSC